MTITAYGTGAYRTARPNEFVSTRAQFDDLQRQLDTQKRSTSYGDLGIDRRVSLDLNAKISAIDSWLSGIELSSVNLKMQAKTVEGIAGLASTIRTDISTSSYLPTEGGRTGPQILAENSFTQMIDLLNLDVNGRYLFSGRASDVRPTERADTIIDGDGLRAGLRQLIRERAAADGITDPGTVPAGTGRVSASAGGTSTVTLAREAGIDPAYGFSISRLSSGSTNVSVSALPAAPAAATSLSIAVNAQPLVGETLRIKLDLPDGTQTEIALTARGTGASASGGFVIGADVNETAANIETALNAALTRESQSTLRAASAVWTSEDFFNSNPPNRVSPPYGAPPVPGTAADTVIWYRGESDPAVPARLTAGVQVDKTLVVATGTRANEKALTTPLAQIAALALVSFPQSEATAQAGYNALTERVRDNLGYEGTQKPSEITTELGIAQNALKAATERHEATKGFYETALEGVEGVDKTALAVQMLTLRTSLEASYQVTSILANLTLTKYL